MCYSPAKSEDRTATSANPTQDDLSSLTLPRLSVGGRIVNFASNEFANKTDRELVALCLLEDSQAQNALFSRYWQKVVHVCSQRLGGDQFQAEDAAQEVFLRLFNTGLYSYNPARACLNTYITRIAINHCTDLLRRKCARILLLTGQGGSESGTSEYPGIPDPALGPASFLASNEMRQAKEARARETINKLSPPLREIVELVYLNNLTLKEVSKVLDVKLGTIKSRLSAALKQLRKVLVLEA